MVTPIVIQLNCTEFQQGKAVGAQILTAMLPQTILLAGTGSQLKNLLIQNNTLNEHTV